MADSNNSSSQLEEARAALQSNQAARAVDLLNSLLQQDPNHAEAYELLGVAQCQLGLVADGIRSLSTAVNFNPASANARVNLAVALHKSNRTQEAVLQLTEALRLDPAHARARQALASIQGAAPAPAAAPPPNYLSGSQPLRTDLAGNPIEQTQPIYGQTPPVYGQPGAYGASPTSPYGGPPPVMQAPRAYTPMPPPTDAWSPVNMFRVLKNPADFFVPHIGQEELGQPLVFFLICTLISSVCSLIHSMNNPLAGPASAGGVIGGFVGSVVAVFLTAGVTHMFVRMFGGGAGFGATFRAMVYGQGPMVVGTVAAALLSFAGPAGTAFGGLIALVFLIWSIVVMVNGLNVLQDLSSGQSCGAMILSGIIVGILAIGAMFAIFAANPSFRDEFMKQFNAAQAAQRRGQPMQVTPGFPQPGNPRFVPSDGR